MKVELKQLSATETSALSGDSLSNFSAKTQDPGHPASHEPLVVIEPTRSLAALKLRDIWIYRELLYFMVWRDLKVRYKQTALGVLWVILQPFLMTLVFTVVLGKLVRVPTQGTPYALFAYVGLTLWIFFSSAVSLTSNCLVQNANLITKVYFPRLIVPISSIIARIVDLAVSLLILAGLLIYYGVGPSWHLVMVPVVVLLTSLLALAFGLWTSAVNVKYRDVGLVIPVVIQLWMFVSPIVYPTTAVPGNWRRIYSLNPLVGLLDAFRSAVFGTPFDWFSLSISISITLILLPYAAYSFQHREKTFADII